MKIVVCAKFVPDATADRRFRSEDNTVYLASVHVNDDRIHSSDTVATSVILAKALGKFEADLVVFGMACTDGSMGVVPAMVSERRGLPGVTLCSSVTVDGNTVTIRRDRDTASDTVEGTLPLVLSGSDHSGEPRWPSFKGTVAAKKKLGETWSLADLEISADQVGGAAAWTEVTEVTARQPHSAGTIVTDESRVSVPGAFNHVPLSQPRARTEAIDGLWHQIAAPCCRG
jgi:electron transfer flavoprotein beta subunit